MHSPTAFPAAHAMKVAATTADFLVCPAIFRETMDNVNV
jgi:hypothetical protein